MAAELSQLSSRHLLKVLMALMKQQLGYLVSTRKYVEEMEAQKQQLKERALYVQRNRDMAVEKTEVIPIGVDQWLLEVEILDKRSNLIEPIGCFNVTKRYEVGSQSYRILQQIGYLKKEGSKIEFTHEQLRLGGVAGSTSTASVSLSSTEYSDIPPYPDTDKREQPNLPRGDLTMDLSGGERYFRFCVPLFEASMRCDWNAAKAIFYDYPHYVNYSITENKETALHVASSKKRSKHVENFVKKLVNMMDVKDLELENKQFTTALYMAAVAGNIDTVKIMVEKNRKLLTIMGGNAANIRMMPLHAAALFGNHEVVRYLYEESIKLEDEDWNLKNLGWLLEKCVEGDMFDVALKIVTKDPGLGSAQVLRSLAGKPDAFSEKKSNFIKRGIQSVFALIGLRVGAYEEESEALQVLKKIWKNIVNNRKDDIDKILRGPPDSQNLIQVLPLQKLIYDHLSKLRVQSKHIMEMTSSQLNKYELLDKLIDDHLRNILNETENLIQKKHMTFPRKKGRSLELQELMNEHVVNIYDKFLNIKMHAHEEERQRYLQKLISKHVAEMYALSGLNREKYSSQILFIAAEVGNTKFIVELVHRYPDLLWKVNDDNQTIFHIAIRYRHEGIYNLLYEIGSLKDFVFRLEDADDNNMLHLVGKRAMKELLANVSGPALQMQRELLWFEEVKNMMPPYYRERKNKDGLTPHELFTKEHRELIKEGEEWIKGVASQCMVVAALIATIVFAAAFTIPGGYNQTDGIPIFYQKTIFVVFVVADAMSLFLSSASILTFLSILTSRYAERDFVGSLPKKLMLGISTLFLSITAMMITFSVSFFILYHKEMKWIPIFISVFAVTPVLLYVFLQYHLLVDVIRSTYGSKYLFKPGKQVLYYKNPKV